MDPTFYRPDGTIAAEIYAFAGNLGSGKNHVAEKLFAPLLPPMPTIFLAFADHFKVDCCLQSAKGAEICYETIFGQKTEQSRLLLQQYGASSRERHGPDIWNRYLEIWMRVHWDRGIRRFIITDARYPNEFEWIHRWGGKVFLVVAPQRHLAAVHRECKGDEIVIAKVLSHNSESQIANAQGVFDAVIHNDPGDPTKSDLTKVLTTFLG